MKQRKGGTRGRSKEKEEISLRKRRGTGVLRSWTFTQCRWKYEESIWVVNKRKT
jgi:hypothetical protein